MDEPIAEKSKEVRELNRIIRKRTDSAISSFGSPKEAKVAFDMSRMILLREFLEELNLGDRRITEEIEWGINTAKSEKDLKNHAGYIRLLLEVVNLAFSGVKQEPEDKGKGKTLQEFMDYIQNSMNEKEAALVIESLRGFNKFREGDLSSSPDRAS